MAWSSSSVRTVPKAPGCNKPGVSYTSGPSSLKLILTTPSVVPGDADAVTPFATWLLPGVHTVRLVPPLGTEGLVIQEHKIVATVGKPVMVALDLEPFTTPEGPALQTANVPGTDEPDEEPTNEVTPAVTVSSTDPSTPAAWQAITGWTGVGVGLATLGTGALFTSFAADSHAAIESLDPALGDQEGALQYKALVDDMERQQNTSFALYGLGATSLITGTVLLLMDMESQDAVESVLLEPIRGGFMASGSLRF